MYTNFKTTKQPNLKSKEKKRKEEQNKRFCIKFSKKKNTHKDVQKSSSLVS